MKQKTFFFLLLVASLLFAGCQEQQSEGWLTGSSVAKSYTCSLNEGCVC